MTDPHANDPGDEPPDEPPAGEQPADRKGRGTSCPFGGNMFPKPKPLQETHTKIHWRAPSNRVATIKVVAHTCECASTIYELCSAGGLGHIRRTVRIGKKSWISESPWLHTAKARALWNALLAGHAR